ncbi:MAG: YncE family protein [Arenimonas sp.]
MASSLPRAYIANAADGTVSVIDTGTRTVIATIAVGSNPTHVAVNEQGTRAYVRNGETVSVIDTSNNTVIASPVIPGGVLLLNGDGSRLFSHNGFFGNIFAIDTSNYALLATYTIPGPYLVTGFAVNRQGNFVYVSEALSFGGVASLDLISNTWAGTAYWGLGPESLVLNRSGTLLYVYSSGESTLSVVNTSTFFSTYKIPSIFGADEIAISPDGNRIYMTNEFHKFVTVFDTTTNSVAATITLDSSPSGLTVNPADNSVYVTLPQANSVAVIDASTNTVVATIPVGNNPISTGIFIPQYVVEQANVAIRAHGAASVTPGASIYINVIMDNYGPGVAISPSVLLETNAPGTSIDATAPNGWTCMKSAEAEKASFVCNALGNMIAGNKPLIKLHFIAPNSMASSKLVINSQISSESKETNVIDNTNRFSMLVTAPRKIRPPVTPPASTVNKR